MSARRGERRRALVLLASIGAALASPLEAEEAGPPPRQAVPSGEEQKEAAGIIEAAVRQAIAATKEKLPEQDRPSLYLSLAREEWDLPALRFVAYSQAVVRCAEESRIHRMLDAVDEWSARFAIDPLAVKWESMKLAAARPARAEELVVRAKAIVSGGLRVAEEAVRSGDIAAAEKSLKLAEGIARSARFDQRGGLCAASLWVVTARQDEVRDAPERYSGDREKEIRARLAERTDDPRACREMGELLCFGRGDWSAGLPCLEKGDDEDLRDLAMWDRTRATSAAQIIAVAQGWIQRAESMKKDALARRRIEERAIALALPALADLAPAEAARARQMILRLPAFHHASWAALGDAVLWHSFDASAIDAPKSRALDASGAENHARILEARSLAGGQAEALEFDGRLAFVRGEDRPAGFPLGDSPRTIAAWVRTGRAIDRWQPIFSYGELPPSRDYAYCSLALEPHTAAPALHIGRNSIASPTGGAADGRWHQVAAVYEGPDTARVRIYWDGREVHADHARDRVDTQISTTRWMIGRGDRGYFDGDIDEVMLFARALTAEEIAAIHLRQLAR